MRVEQLLKDGAERFGAKAAIVVGRRHHSYRDLDTKSARLADALGRRGVTRGDRVAVFLDNSFEAVVSTFAILRAGAVVCPVDPGAAPERLAAVLGETDAVGIVTEARLASAAAAAIAGAPRIRVVVLTGGSHGSAEAGCLNFEDIVGAVAALGAPLHAGESSDPAIVVSVADGYGLAQTLTHEDLVAAAAGSETPLDAVVVASLPISSHYGLYQLLTAIKAGATQVLQCTSALRQSVFNRADQFQADLKLSLAG